MYFDQPSEQMKEIFRIIDKGAKNVISNEKIIENEVNEWLSSSRRELMLIGERYYRNETDITKRKRFAINEFGAQVEDKKVANNKLANGFTKELVDQKVSYLLSAPVTVQTNNKEYSTMLNEIFDNKFHRLLMNVGKESINKGIAWLHPFYDEQGVFKLKRIPSEEIIPLWQDIDHTELSALIRVYTRVIYDGQEKVEEMKVEYWNTEGVYRYVYSKDGLIPDVEAGVYSGHVTVQGQDHEQSYNWDKLPFIPFKYNDEELPLINYIKSLVDDYDKQKSDVSNLLEDSPNSAIVVKGYAGSEASEFRANLNMYRVIFLNGAEANEGVETLTLELNVDAYKYHQDNNKKDIYKFGRGVDSQDEKAIGQSGKALEYLYNNLDLDASMIEMELQASLEQLLWFVDRHLANTTGKDWTNESVEFIFNKEMIVNDSEVIQDLRNSVGMISKETMVANHPYVRDAQAELERMDKEMNKEEMGIGIYSEFDRIYERGETENVERKDNEKD